MYTPVRGSMQLCGEHCIWTRIKSSGIGNGPAGIAMAAPEKAVSTNVNASVARRMMTSMSAEYCLTDLNGV